MVRAAGRFGIVQPTCLVESLALWHLLDEQKISSTLRIGVRKSRRKFEAHAWVEYAGNVLCQTEEHRHYAAFNSELLDRSGEPS
jgi:Transglutaminase-like superfamily